MNEKVLVLCEDMEKLLFVVQFFRERYGVYVTVRIIAPSTPKLEKLSYHLSCSVDGHTLTYKSPEMKRFLEVSSQIPEESFMFFHNSLLRHEMLEMRLCVYILD